MVIGCVPLNIVASGDPKKVLGLFHSEVSLDRPFSTLLLTPRLSLKRVHARHRFSRKICTCRSSIPNWHQGHQRPVFVPVWCFCWLCLPWR